MPFMQVEITEKTKWWSVDGNNGTHFFPAEYFTKKQALDEYDYEFDVNGRIE